MSEENLKTYALKEVSENNNRQSVWLVIHNNIYDVTKFLAEHPGGEEVLLEMGGKDATENFEDVGHSTDARDLMKQYKIGELCEEDKVKTEKEVSTKKEESGGSWTFWIVAAVMIIVGVAVFYRFQKSLQN